MLRLECPSVSIKRKSLVIVIEICHSRFGIQLFKLLMIYTRMKKNTRMKWLKSFVKWEWKTNRYSLTYKTQTFTCKNLQLLAPLKILTHRKIFLKVILLWVHFLRVQPQDITKKKKTLQMMKEEDPKQIKSVKSKLKF